MAASLVGSFFLEAEMRINHLFKTLLRDWVMNPSYPDLYFREVTEEFINYRPVFNLLHDDLDALLEKTDYASHPSAELTSEDLEQEPASQFDDPLPADFAGFSYHIPEEKWEQRAIPEPFRRRINLVLESNCPDYGYFCRAFKSLLMYAFVPQKIKNRSTTPIFRDKIERTFKLCKDKEIKLQNFIEILVSLYEEEPDDESTMTKMEDFEKRLDSVCEILNILRILLQFETY